MSETIRFEVTMGQMVVARNPHIISCGGLGSCVALMLYDPERRIGGLAHIMLPNNKCADMAIAALLETLHQKGGIRGDLVAKMAGGSAMFVNGDNSKPGIGQQNITSIRRILNLEGIPLIAEDVGGHHGRSIRFDLASGQVTIAAVGKGDRKI